MQFGSKKGHLQSGNVPPYILVVGKNFVESSHVTCGVWRKSGLSRSDYKNVINDNNNNIENDRFSAGKKAAIIMVVAPVQYGSQKKGRSPQI